MLFPTKSVYRKLFSFFLFFFYKTKHWDIETLSKHFQLSVELRAIAHAFYAPSAGSVLSISTYCTKFWSCSRYWTENLRPWGVMLPFRADYADLHGTIISIRQICVLSAVHYISPKYMFVSMYGICIHLYCKDVACALLDPGTLNFMNSSTNGHVMQNYFSLLSGSCIDHFYFSASYEPHLG